MTQKRRKPDIGETMYHVCEHLYYVEKRAAPVLEYCVCSAVVKSFFKGGYTEVRLVGKSPGGYMTPYSHPLTEIGEKLFYTSEEAAVYARQRTEQYEHNWADLDSAPLRRTWEKYLNGKEGTESD